jgi:hypothetical protein
MPEQRSPKRSHRRRRAQRAEMGAIETARRIMGERLETVVVLLTIEDTAESAQGARV